MEPPSHADCVPWAFETSQLHRPRLEWHCRTADRIDPARVFGPYRCLERGTSAPDSEILRRLLQRRQNASVIEQRCACLSPGSAIRRHNFTRHPGRASSPIRSGLSFRYTQGAAECRIMGRKLAIDPRQIEHSCNHTHLVIVRHHLFKAERIKQLSLILLQPTHYGPFPPLTASTSGNHCSRQPSTDFRNKICQQRTERPHRCPLASSAPRYVVCPVTATFARWRKPFRALRRSVATCGRRIELVVGV
jgi:hypothetical protein